MFKLKVHENEKALIYKDEKFVKLLDVGVYKMFPFFNNQKVEKVDIRPNGIDGEKARRLHQLFPEKVAEYFTVVDLADHERAYVLIDGKFTDFLHAGELKLYWRELGITVERVDVAAEYRLTDRHMEFIRMFPTAVRGIRQITVSPHESAYLYRDETYVETLPPGTHGFYTEFNPIEIRRVDSRIQALEITGQELLSADKVTLRCNLTMHYQVVDGQTWLNKVDAPEAYLYKQLQFAVRKHLGAHSVDAILSRQHTLSDEIVKELGDILWGIGVLLEGVHIKDIILPGEMREIFNQVIEASKRAEANNIHRRGETAATRSLLNTAKLMRDNPALARLKELEALEKITQTVGTLNVYGGLEHVMHGLVDLKGA